MRSPDQGSQERTATEEALALVLIASPVSAACWSAREIDQPVVIGRLASGLRGDSRMSRQHATVRPVEGGLLLRDGAADGGRWKASANGTMGPTGDAIGNRELRLRVGDSFQTGDSLWLVVEAPSAADRATLLHGYSRAVRRAREDATILAEQVARRLVGGQRLSLSLLVSGPRGTGKQVVAREVHRLIAEAVPGAPFRQVSAPSLSDRTCAADLFGVEAGYAAEVGARPGCFEQAHGGVLLLDEVGDTPLAVQPRLLNALQEREVTRLGGSTSLPFECLVVGTTNRDLEQAVAEGHVRQDLLDRLATFRIALPALRERPEDIPPLTVAILQEIGWRGASLGAELMRALMLRWWPGNARELRNTLERLVALGEHSGEALAPWMLDRVAVEAAPGPPDPASRSAPVRRCPDRETMRSALEDCGWNRAELARRWNKDPRQIRRWVTAVGLDEEAG